MTTSPHKASAARSTGSKRAGPRPRFVQHGKGSDQAIFSSLLAELQSLGKRGGSALGGAYALAARSVLERLERLEDLNAERRAHHLGKAPAPPAASARGTRSKKSLPPAQ